MRSEELFFVERASLLLRYKHLLSDSAAKKPSTAAAPFDTMNPGKDMTWEEYVKYLKANSSPETIACIEEAQQRAAATAYANTENHPSSKHIKIDTTKRSPRTLHSKANA